MSSFSTLLNNIGHIKKRSIANMRMRYYIYRSIIFNRLESPIMKEFTVIALSTWKFAATFPVAVYAFKMSFFETILYTNVGGLIGIIFFALLSKGFLKIIKLLCPGNSNNSRKSKKIFTRRNKRIIFLKNKFALPGVLILTPVLLSIPVGVFIVTRYFGRKNINFLYLLVVQFLWSVIFTTIYFNIKIAL